MNVSVISWADIFRFAVVFFRVCGIMVFAPFFNIRSFPYQVRIAFALVSTLALYPAANLGALPQEFGMSSILAFAFSETLLGMVLGLAASFVFAAMQFAGQIISFQLGFSLINLIDPQSEVEMSVFSFFENYLGLLFFLLISGHHWFLLAVSESFSYLPVQGMHLSGPIVQEMILLSSKIIVTGVQIAAPVLAITIIADTVIGIIGRAAPQINILIVGMPLKTLIGFACLGISFYFLPALLGGAFIRLSESMFTLLHAMR